MFDHRALRSLPPEQFVEWQQNRRARTNAIVKFLALIRRAAAAIGGRRRSSHRRCASTVQGPAHDQPIAIVVDFVNPISDGARFDASTGSAGMTKPGRPANLRGFGGLRTRSHLHLLRELV
jgi:hypothetical protein